MEELGRYITIGQYLPTGSRLHRMDPRYKLLGFVLLIIAASAPWSILGTFAVLVAALLLTKVARIPIGYALNGLRPVLPIVIVTLLAQVLFFHVGPGQTVWWHWGWLNLSPSGVHLIVVTVIKFISILLIISILTLSTSLTEITRGVEQLLRPLSVLRFPSHEAALIATITLRFVPTFVEEAERLVKAQASRGAPLGTVRRWQVVRIARGILPLVVPLFIGALRKGEQLALAMEARGFVPGLKRTSYTSLHATTRDIVYVLACLAFCILVLTIPFPA